MEKTTWKTIAIIILILFIIENFIIIYGIYLIEKEEKLTYECYYDICEEYPDALYEEPLCTCYDYDLMGDYVIAKQKILE